MCLAAFWLRMVVESEGRYRMSRGAEAPDGVQNARLYHALEAYCRQGVAIANARVKGCEDAGEFHETALRAEFSGREWSYRYSDEVLWSRVVSHCEDALTETAEHRGAVEALSDDTAISRQLGNRVWVTGRYGRCPEAAGCVRSLLLECLQQGSGRFDAEAFEALYAEVEQYFYGDRLRVRYLAPLGGLQTEEREIALDRQFSIVTVGDEERARIVLGSTGLPGNEFYPARVVGMRPHAFELYVEATKRVGVNGEAMPAEDAEGSPDHVAMERFDEACSALRLFKGGDVGYDWVWSRFACCLVSGGEFSFGPLETRLSFPGSYVLSAEEGPEFKKFWRRWGRRKRDDKLDLAVRRFSMGCERRLAEDRLIDYVVALEALLLVGLSGEYRYRMSLRGAALVGEDALDRAAVRRNLVEAYDIRSEIVHGSAGGHETVTKREKPEWGRELKKTEVAFGAFVDLVGDYLRSVIIKVEGRLEDKDLGEVLEDVDDGIVKGFGGAQRV